MLFAAEGTLWVEKAQPRTSVVTATAQGCPGGEGPGAVQEEVGFRWATGPEDEWDPDVQDRGALREGSRGRGRGGAGEAFAAVACAHLAAVWVPAGRHAGGWTLDTAGRTPDLQLKDKATGPRMWGDLPCSGPSSSPSAVQVPPPWQDGLGDESCALPGQLHLPR